MGRKSNFSNIIIAPRSLDLTVYFVLGICLLIPGAMLIFAALFSLLYNSFKDFFLGLLFSALPLGFGVLAFFASAKGRARIFIDIENNNIKIMRSSSKEKIIEIDKIGSFCSKRVTYPFPGLRKYSLDAKNVGGNESIKLFDETLITPAIKWEIFAKKLARRINKPLKTESHVEDKNLSLFNLGSK